MDEEKLKARCEALARDTWELEGALGSASAYYEGAAREVLGTAALLLHNNRTLPSALKDYIVRALWQIAKGGDPARALFLKRNGRTPHSGTDAKLMRIALRVWYYHQTKHAPLADTRRKDSAFELAAKECHVSPSRARQAWKQHRSEIRAMMEPRRSPAECFAPVKGNEPLPDL